MKNKAVFLDRDGVIIIDKHYISNPEDVELTYNAAKAIKILSGKGYKTVVVTNQSGIARGYYTERDYKKVTQKMENLLDREGAKLDLILCSPYHPEGKIKKYTKKSNMRKPGAGMFLKATEKLGIDFEQSFMIGDKASDVKAGKSLGMKTILIKSEYGGMEENPDYYFDSLYEAVTEIFGE